jgi:hypothetical protein
MTASATGARLPSAGHPRRDWWKSSRSGLRRSCETCRMTERQEGGLAAVLYQELTTCRKRGIERLDVHSHNQVPVERPQLQHLSEEYLQVRRIRAQGLVARLKLFLRDAVKAFEAESKADAQLVSALFFGDSQDRVSKSAGELLDIAQRKSGFDNDIRFRQARREAFSSFAEFLPRFVASAAHGDEEEAVVIESSDTMQVPRQSSHNGDIPAPEVQQHVATTGYIDSGEHFITLLSAAESVTVIGLTNEKLASMLRTALARKRAAMLRPDGSWSSIRVVFLSDELLDWVNDERGYPDPDEARLLRRRLAVYGRRTVRVFLRGLPGRTSWGIYDSRICPRLSARSSRCPTISESSNSWSDGGYGVTQTIYI